MNGPERGDQITACDVLRVVWPELRKDRCCNVCHAQGKLIEAMVEGRVIRLCCAMCHSIWRYERAGGPLHLELEGPTAIRPTLRVRRAV